MRNVVTGAIVEGEVPCEVVASCGEEDKRGFCCVQE